ncbi:MAG: hypothetical protein V1913_16690 [Fibrobacterota bacterium]
MAKKKSPPDPARVAPAAPSTFAFLTTGIFAPYAPYCLLLLLTLCFFLPFIFSRDMIYGSDMVNGIYSKIFYADFFSRFYTFPRWNPLSLSGMPTLDAFMGDMFYPLAFLNVMGGVDNMHKALGYKYVVSVFMAGCFMFLFLRKGLSLRTGVALLFAVGFMFNTEFTSHMFPGHDGKMFVISLLPLALFSLKRLLDTLDLRFIALLALSIGLMLLTSHVQTTYFTLWGLFFYFVFETVRGFLNGRDRKKAALRAGAFALAVGLGLGCGMVQFLPPYTFTKQYSVRGEGDKTSYEHAISWSIHPEEAAALIVPEFCGFADKDQAYEGPRYWGRNPFKLNNEYAGIVALAFAVFFIALYRRERFVLFWAGLGLFALVYALGGNTPFFYLFYALLPGVKLFRAPSMIMFWFSMALCVISAWGLDRLLGDMAAGKTDFTKPAKRLFIAFGVLTVLTLVAAAGQNAVYGFWKGLVFSGMGPDKTQAFNANYPSFVRGSLFAFLFGGSALIGLWAFLKGALKPGALIGLLMIIMVADLFRVDYYFFKLVDPLNFTGRNEPALNDLAQKAVNEKFRVLPVPGHAGDNEAQLYGLESVGGFHDNELKWYREFRGGQMSENFLTQLQQGRVEGNAFLDLLNVRYVIFRPGKDKGLVYAENQGALPRAFCISQYDVVDSGAILSRLRDSAFPYRTRLLLTEKPGIDIAQNNTLPCGRVEKIEYTGNRRVYEADMRAPGLLVFSEIFLPYWQATVNGVRTKVLRADYALMAVALPAGKQRVEFAYESPNIARGAKITFASLAVCIALLCAGFALKRRRAPGAVESVNG